MSSPPASPQVGFIANLANEANHDVVEKALMALGCMEHRGGCSADDDSGDGAGLMTNLPWELFKQDLPELKEASTGCGAPATWGCFQGLRSPHNAYTWQGRRITRGLEFEMGWG